MFIEKAYRMGVFTQYARGVTATAVMIGACAIVVLTNGWIPVDATWIARSELFVSIFLGIMYEAIPFLTAGALVAAGIHLFISPAWLTQRLTRWPRIAVIIGSMLGMIFPVCECGSIPAARSLIQRGATPQVGLAFALAAPVVNPIVLLSTSVAFVALWGWSFVVWRFVLTIIIAVLTAYAFPRIQLIHTPHDAAHHYHDADEIPLLAWLRHALIDWVDMARYLVAGALIAAMIQAFVPNQLFLDLANQTWLAIPAMMMLAVVMSICSTVDSFVALSFASTVSPAAVMAFLVFGPIIDLKSVPMLAALFGWRHVGMLLAYVAGLTVILTTLLGGLGWL